YTLTFTEDPGCPSSLTGGIPPLPNDFRQPRSYAASVIQSGPSLTVTLTGPEMITTRNSFAGRVEPDSIEFEIGYPAYYSYYGLTLSLAERVSATQVFEFGGRLHAQRSGSPIVGRLDGTLAIANSVGSVIARCMASNNQVTLTPLTQLPQRRCRA